MTEVNIKDGRRTVVASIEWFPRPDGTERAVTFQPGYNGDPDAPPSRNYGVHGMEIWWRLRGPRGGVHFYVFTEWIPGELRPGHGRMPKGYPPREIDQYPNGADLGRHARIPQFEGEENFGSRDDCEMTGGTCYYDGTGLGAVDLAKQFTELGEPAIWAKLEEWYADLKVASDGPAVP